MTDPVQIPIPVPYLGFVNLWLLEGEPLTLIDAGPSNAQASEALDAGLAAHGYAVDQIELLLITHHHLDHAGLAQAIKDRSGATVAAHRTTAQWGAAYHERARQEHRFSEALMLAHGVPEDIVAGTQPFFAHIIADSEGFETDRVLVDGHALHRRRQRRRVRRRPPAREHQLRRGDHADGAPGRRAAAGPARVPEQPPEDGGHAARPLLSRSRSHDR